MKILGKSQPIKADHGIVGEWTSTCMKRYPIYIGNCDVLCSMYNVYLGVKYFCSIFSPFVTYSVHKQYCRLFIEGHLGSALFSVSYFDPIYNITPHCM